jgi:hypothetical protein
LDGWIGGESAGTVDGEDETSVVGFRGRVMEIPLEVGEEAKVREEDEGIRVWREYGHGSA